MEGKRYWSGSDLRQMFKSGETYKGYDRWAMKACDWGSAYESNYNREKGQMTYPDVEYKDGKFYAHVNRSWVEVPFDYDILTPETIEGKYALYESKKTQGVNEENSRSSKKTQGVDVEEYRKYLKELGEYMIRKGFTSNPLPKVILDDSKQDSDVFCYTGYFDPNRNAVRLFVNGRLKKDVLRTWAHELIHWKQQQDGDIERSGYSSDKITEDKNLIHLEGEAYLKGNMAFRSWTEECQKK